jgi:hypothetical protein
MNEMFTTMLCWCGYKWTLELTEDTEIECPQCREQHTAIAKLAEPPDLRVGELFIIVVGEYARVSHSLHDNVVLCKQCIAEIEDTGSMFTRYHDREVVGPCQMCGRAKAEK